VNQTYHEGPAHAYPAIPLAPAIAALTPIPAGIYFT